MICTIPGYSAFILRFTVCLCSIPCVPLRLVALCPFCLLVPLRSFWNRIQLVVPVVLIAVVCDHDSSQSHRRCGVYGMCFRRALGITNPLFKTRLLTYASVLPIVVSKSCNVSSRRGKAPTPAHTVWFLCPITQRHPWDFPVGHRYHREPGVVVLRRLHGVIVYAEG
jgi:hypothetical protein